MKVIFNNKIIKISGKRADGHELVRILKHNLAFKMRFVFKFLKKPNYAYKKIKKVTIVTFT